MPDVGARFTLLQWTQLTGQIGSVDLSAAALPEGLEWDLSQLATAGIVTVRAALPESVQVPVNLQWLLFLAFLLLGAAVHVRRTGATPKDPR